MRRRSSCFVAQDRGELLNTTSHILSGVGFPREVGYVLPYLLHLVSIESHLPQLMRTRSCLYSRWNRASRLSGLFKDALLSFDDERGVPAMIRDHCKRQYEMSAH